MLTFLGADKVKILKAAAKALADKVSSSLKYIYQMTYRSWYATTERLSCEKII